MRSRAIAILAVSVALGAANGAMGAPLDNLGFPNTTMNPYLALFFRETNLDGNNTAAATESHPQQLSLDSKLTVADQIEKLYSEQEDQSVDPAAYIRIGFADEWWANIKLEEMGSDEQAMNRPGPFDHEFERQRMHYNLTVVKKKLNLIFKKSHQPARSLRDFQAIRLGASLLAHETLSTNINSYVPDGFNDGEIARMFELNEALRTGAKSLNATELAEINLLIFDLYMRALSGLEGPVKIEQASAGVGVEECPICQDLLREEPACSLLGCGHRFHVDCVMSWMRDKFITKCTLCRQRFRQALDFPQIQ